MLQMRRATLQTILMLLATAMAPAALAQPTSPPASQLAPPTAADATRLYPWRRRHSGYNPMVQRIKAPAGYARVAAPRGSYARWLRHLPLFPAGRAVRSYRGGLILGADHRSLAAVVDLDLSKRDRQQCADTIMRLRGEYLHWRGLAQKVAFRWAGGKRFGYRHWCKGLRPQKKGRRWDFVATARPGRGYRHFRRYLEFMFSWTGTMHQVGEARVKAERIRPGDFFIQGGSPGHAVVVLDMARDRHGKIKLLIGQGYMPAQDLHVMRAGDGSPWFDWDPQKGTIKTPFWHTFRTADLRRFRF